MNVNQAEAFRRGINAPHSTAKIDVDPSQFTEEQRNIVADFLSSPASSGFILCGLPPVITPDLDGLLASINKVIERKKEEADRNAREKQRCIEATLDILNNKRTFERRYDVILIRNDDGAVVQTDSNYCQGDKPHGRAYYEKLYQAWPDNAWQEIKESEASLAWRKELDVINEQERLCAIKRATEDLILEEQRASQKADATKRLHNQIVKKVEEIGGLTAKRWSEGFSSDSEIIKIIREEERTKYGVTLTGGTKDWERDASDNYCGPLTDEHYSNLMEWKSKLPPEAVIELFELYYYDEDSKLKSDRIIVADAKWKCGEINVSADERIGALEDEVGEE